MGAHHRPDTDDSGWTWTGHAWQGDTGPGRRAAAGDHPFDRPQAFTGGPQNSRSASADWSVPAGWTPPYAGFDRPAAPSAPAWLESARRWWESRNTSDRRTLIVLGSALLLVVVVLVAAANSGPAAPQWSAAEQQLIADAHDAGIHPLGDDIIVNLGQDVCSTDTMTSFEMQLSNIQSWGAERGQMFNYLAHQDLCRYLDIPELPRI